MFFAKKSEFDNLLTHVPESDKKELLKRYLHVELATAWLKESGLKFDAGDVLRLVGLITGKLLP